MTYSLRDPAAARALVALPAAMPRALAGRRALPAHIEAEVRMLERIHAG